MKKYIAPVVVLSSACTLVQAGIDTDFNAMPAFQGQLVYNPVNASFPFATFIADLSYAVYEPGDFTLSFPGEVVDPTHYVYAYQVDSVSSTVYSGIYGGAYVQAFSINIQGDEQITAATSVAGSGTVAPNTGGVVPTSVSWDFIGGLITPGNSSEVLYYTSPFGPEFDNSALSGTASFFDEQQVPTPVPEPASLALLGLGGLAMLRRR